MDPSHIFNKFVASLAHRAHFLNCNNSDHMHKHMQSLVYQMVHEVPGAAEYLNQHTQQMEQLQEMENGHSVPAVDLC